MPIELIDLRTVSTAARLASFSRAAEALNLTQPALSRRIAEVERSLGVALFDRLARGVRPTEACLAFLRHAEVALTSIDNAREAAREAESRRAREVSLGILENLCDDTLFAACRDTLTNVEGSAINFIPRSLSAEISADLLSGATRLALRYGRDPNPQLEAQWVADDPIVIACGAAHPLAAKGSATVDELEREQWIGNTAAVDPAEAVEDLPTAVFRGWSAVKMAPVFARLALLEAGFGLAMVRRAGIQQQVASGAVVVLETPLALSIPVFLAWRRGASLGEAAEYLRGRLLAPRRQTA